MSRNQSFEPLPVSAEVPATASTRPAHEHAYLDLREMILFGDLAPGQPVTIQGLTETLGAGMTPVREAIRRLTSEGALAFHGNRRVSVPKLSPSDIEDVIFVRKTIDTELSRRAALHAKPDQIERLRAIDDALDTAIVRGDIRGYLTGNYLFHTGLYALAQAPLLAEVTDRLWLRFGPSLRVVCGRLGTQNLPDWHKEILDALRAGDAEAAAQATARDLEQGTAEMIAALELGTSQGDSIDRA